MHEGERGDRRVSDPQDPHAIAAAYYATRLAEHGTTHRGVDWNSQESQYLRFEQLARVLPPPGPGALSVLDYGCGYGELQRFLAARYPDLSYVGFDLVPEALAAAREHIGEGEGVRFVGSLEGLEPCDFTLASGVFGVKREVPDAAWGEYARAEVAAMAAASRRGFAFNMLTSYSDADRMRPDLHYADPCAWFDHLKRTYARDVALLHDYGLYEFTMLVRLG